MSKAFGNYPPQEVNTLMENVWGENPTYNMTDTEQEPQENSRFTFATPTREDPLEFSRL